MRKGENRRDKSYGLFPPRRKNLLQFQNEEIFLCFQGLREWFAEKMGKLGVSDRYIDAFCGRTPKTVLANNYTDFSPDKLKEVYEEAGIEVLA